MTTLWVLKLYKGKRSGRRGKGILSFIHLFSLCFVILSVLLLFKSIALAQSTEEKNYLLLYFKEEELVAEAPTRASKSLSHTAENISIVTADEIKLMNAHTVADVLNTLTGVQVWKTGGPGSMATAYIQGSEQKHVTVMIDGIVMNNLSDTVVELGMIPVQMIDKIEIIKGPASSSWGSALGGVVNIITKSGKKAVEGGGIVSAAYGTKNTGDFRIKGHGGWSNGALYISGGQLQSDGLTPYMDVSSRNVYSKLNVELTERTDMVLSTGYSAGRRNDGLFPLYDMSFNDIFRNFHALLSANTALSETMDINISMRTIRQELVLGTDQASTGLPLFEDKYEDGGYGASMKVAWKPAFHSIILGLDLDKKVLESNTIADKQGVRKWAIFANDTMVLDRVSITPGIRYERTNTNDAVTSPSLGVTYSFTDTILRASMAKGFNIPPISYTYGNTVFYSPNPDLKVERVQSYQAGAETTVFPFLWTKLSVFRNEIRDAISPDPASANIMVNSDRQRRQGIEAEFKTMPIYFITVSAGAEFVSARDLNTGQKLDRVPSRIFDVAVQYSNERIFSALLQGRHIDWNAIPSDQGKYQSVIYDFSLIRILSQKGQYKLELFGKVHNLFNGEQYLTSIYKNPGRWYEGGVRYSF